MTFGRPNCRLFSTCGRWVGCAPLFLPPRARVARAAGLHRPEGGAFRPADRRAGHRVDFLDGVVPGLERAEHPRDAEEADVVGDEVRGVLRKDDALAETMIGEVRYAFDDRRIGPRGRDGVDEA